MLEKTYKILKYISKRPNTTKQELTKKFSFFENYKNTILDYVYIVDKNVDFVQQNEEKLISEAEQQGLCISEISKYVNERMSDVKSETDDELIFYSTNLKFEEYCERKRQNALMFWVPYIITTVIAIISLFT